MYEMSLDVNFVEVPTQCSCQAIVWLNLQEHEGLQRDVQLAVLNSQQASGVGESDHHQ